MSERTWKRHCAALAIFCYGLACHGQGLGTIVGTVTDPSGAVIPAPKVTATETRTTFTRTVIGDSQGYFVVPSLRPTEYTITAEAQGFSRFTESGVTLRADQSLTLNIQLKVGHASEKISVESTAPPVDTYTPTLRQVVDEQRMVELPLNGRNAAALTTLVAGVVVDNGFGNDADQGSTKTFPGAQTISTNGARQNQTSFLLDGANNLDEMTNVNLPFPFPDALQEFSVETSDYGAEHGQNAGGVVNVVTKSGTNQIHGDAFEFLRNSAFNARNFFESEPDQLKRNQFGGTIGGPVVIPKLYNGRDRTFFFAGFQGTEILNTLGAQSAFVPTGAELNGDFSALLNANNPDNPVGQSIQLIDPLTNRPFPGNKIDPTRFDPASLKLVETYLPKAAGNGHVIFPQPLKEILDEVVGRFDQAIGSKDQLTYRFYVNRYHHYGQFDNNNLLTDSTDSVLFTQNHMLHDTHAFRPNVVNDVRLSFSRIVSRRGPLDSVPSLRDLGVSIYQPAGVSVGISGISAGDFFSISNAPPATFTRQNYTLSDDVTWVAGRHDIRFGGSIEISRYDLSNLFLVPGEVTFSGDYTGNALADLLLGRVRSFQQGNGDYRNLRNKFYGAYVQDTFKASKGLTLTYGVRWEPWYPWHETHNRVYVFNPSAYSAGKRSTVFTNAPPGESFPGDPGFPKDGVNPARDLIAPRVGFAYDVFGDGKTSLRGGAGIFYDSRSVAWQGNGFSETSPFSVRYSLTNPPGPFSNPLAGMSSPFPVPFPPPSNIAFPSPVLAVTFDPSGRFSVPTLYNWNLTLERQLPWDLLMRFSYVGSHSSHIKESVDLNPSVYIPSSTLGPDDRRFFPGYSDIFQDSQSVNANYNSLQVTVEKRFKHHFTVLANYAFSKSLDDQPFGGGVEDIGADNLNTALPWYFPNFHSMDRGPSEFDLTHFLNVSYVWQLASFSGANRVERAMLGGWELTGIISAHSGDPVTLLAGVDQSKSALGTDRVVYLGGPQRLAGPCAGVSPCVNWINPASFGIPAIGTFGNLGKGALRGPGYFNWDAGIFKNFAITERWRVQFRVEFFNVFNHANFLDPNYSLTGGGFGQIFSARDPRIGQLSLKILW